MSVFQDNLRNLRKQHGYTQEKLSELLGIGREKIVIWEKGGRSPDLNELLKICDIFDCDLDYLVGRIEQPTHSLQDISDITGLSIKSIEQLQEWNNERSYEHGLYIRSDVDYLNNILESFPDLLCRIDNVLTNKEYPDRYRKVLCMRVALKLWNHITDQDSDLIEMGNISKFASDFVYERLSYLEEELYNKQK